MSSAPDWRAQLLAHWQRPQPSALARALQPLSWLYRGAAAVDRALHDTGLRRRERAPRPLVVVGNLLVGGAGKTPTVIALAALLQRIGYRPGVISRGHGRRDTDVRLVVADSDADEVGDEPLLVHLRARVPVAVAARRIDAARALCAHDAAIDVVIADDGLQHHGLERDVQVVVFDARGAGNGLLLPAGPLREPMPLGVPPRTLVLYSDGVSSTPLPGHLATRRLAGAVALEAWWQGAAPTLATLHALRGREAWACAGTARPERFFEMLRTEGLRLRGLPLPDHAPYRELPWPDDATDVLVTEKDAVKLPPARIGARTRVWVCPLDFVLPPDFGAAVVALLPAARPAA